MVGGGSHPPRGGAGDLDGLALARAGFLDAHLLLRRRLALGCLNAWYWVSKERKIIEEDRKRE